MNASPLARSGDRLAMLDARVAEAQAGGACALCGRACTRGSYCLGCGNFVCWTHGESVGRGRGPVRADHEAEDHR